MQMGSMKERIGAVSLTSADVLPSLCQTMPRLAPLAWLSVRTCHHAAGKRAFSLASELLLTIRETCLIHVLPGFVPLIIWKNSKIDFIIANWHQNHLSGNISVYFPLSSSGFQKFNLQVDLINYFYKLLNESIPKAKDKCFWKSCYSQAGFYKMLKNSLWLWFITLMLL